MRNSKDFFIRPAANFSEKCQAWNVIYKKYLETGFIDPHITGLHFGLLDLMPSSITWLVFSDKNESEVVGTISGVMYSVSGLPCGILYESELRDFGIDGRTVCEFTKLAVEDSSVTSVLEVAGSLIYWCKKTFVDDLICVAHPKHARLWSAVFGWKVIGECREHSGVKGNPGVLMHFDLKRSLPNFEDLPEKGRKILQRKEDSIFGGDTVYRLSGTEVALLLLERSDLVSKSNSSQRLSLEIHYPWATSVISPLLYSAAEGWQKSSSLPRTRPLRESTFKYAGSSSTYNVEPLFTDNNHFAMVLEQHHSDRHAVWESLEKSNFIVIQPGSLEDALLLTSEIAFDVVILNQSLSPSELSELTKSIRKRDFTLHTHTAIIPFSDYTKLIGSSLFEYPNQETWKLETRCAAELSKTLSLIFGTEVDGRNLIDVVNG